MNPGPPDFKSGALTTGPRRLLNSMKVERHLGSSIRKLKPATHLAISCADRRDRRINRRYLACQISAIKFASIRQVCPFQRFSTIIAVPESPGWAILSHEFSKLPHRRDRRKKSPSVSVSIGGENRLRSGV